MIRGAKVYYFILTNVKITTLLRGINMKFYLSSFKLGNNPKDLVRMMSSNKRIACIPNALDFTDFNIEMKNKVIDDDVVSLENLGLDVQILDLRAYFGKVDALRKKISKLGAVFITGGNTFILRQEMSASGFDIVFNEILSRNDFVYSGYSAGICILANNLKVFELVDDPNEKPYKEILDTIWQGLGYLDYVIVPHYRSNHPESAAIDALVEHCQRNGIPFRTLRDGEVMIIE
jgi:dipeptidase E